MQKYITHVAHAGTHFVDCAEEILRVSVWQRDASSEKCDGRRISRTSNDIQKCSTILSSSKYVVEIRVLLSISNRRRQQYRGHRRHLHYSCVERRAAMKNFKFIF